MTTKIRAQYNVYIMHRINIMFFIFFHFGCEKKKIFWGLMQPFCNFDFSSETRKTQYDSVSEW